MPNATPDPVREEPTIGRLSGGVYFAVAVTIGLLCWLYSPVFKWWYGMWNAEESYYSHGILVLPISLFIVWLKRDQILKVPIRPYPLGYLGLVPVLMLVILATWANAQSRGLSFPITLGLLVLILLGKRMAKELAFPIGYLFFMCVLPTFILTKASFGIQMLSTAGATVLLKLIGLEAFRQGAMISLPNIDVLVGSPCSGFRLLISLFAFSVLFVYLKEGPLWGRLTLVAFTLPLSVLLNCLRIMMIALVGEYMGGDAMHAFHDYSGYIVLVLAFVVLSYSARFVKCRKFNSMLIPS